MSKIFKIHKKIYFNHGLPYLGYKSLLRLVLFNIEKLNAFLSNLTVSVSDEMKKKLDAIKPNTMLIHNGSACGVELINSTNLKIKK